MSPTRVSPIVPPRSVQPPEKTAAEMMAEMEAETERQGIFGEGGEDVIEIESP